MHLFRAVRSLAHLSIRLVGDVLSPDACAACDAVLRKRAVFCAECAASVASAPGVRAVAGAAYGGAVAEAIRRLKYGGRPDLAAPLAHLLRAAAREAAPDIDLVVPVPLHPRRLAERGYNQALLIAREVAGELEVGLQPRTLERVRFAPPQASLTRAARRANLDRVFRVRSARDIEGKRVGLVDDVLTTGATFEACRDALLEAGAASVTALVIAETPLVGAA